MNFKLNILTVLSLAFTLLTFVACDKTNGLDVKTAEFSVNHESTYLTKPIVFTANDSLGGNEYSWDFGDGSAISHEINPKHQYGAVGDYNVTLTVRGITGETVTVTNTVSVKSN